MHGYNYKVKEVNGERWINLSGIAEYLRFVEEGFKKEEAYSGVNIVKFLENHRVQLISSAATAKLEYRHFF